MSPNKKICNREALQRLLIEQATPSLLKNNIMGGKRKRASQISIVVDARAERLRQQVDALARAPQQSNDHVNSCARGSLPSMQMQGLQGSTLDQGVHRQYCMMLVKQLEIVRGAVEVLHLENNMIRRELGDPIDGPDMAFSALAAVVPPPNMARQMMASQMGQCMPGATSAPLTGPGLEHPKFGDGPVGGACSRSLPPLFPTLSNAPAAEEAQSRCTPPPAEFIDSMQSMKVNAAAAPLPTQLQPSLEPARGSQTETRKPFEGLSAVPAHMRVSPPQQYRALSERARGQLSSGASASLGSLSSASLGTQDSEGSTYGSTASLRPNLSNTSLHSLGSEASEDLLAYLLNSPKLQNSPRQTLKAY